MGFIMHYWSIILIIIAALAVGGAAIYIFLTKLPTSKQIAKIKEWLLYAVTEAEKEMGSGTGQIKLRYVYDLFTAKFGFIAAILPFETFSNLVDEVLEKFRTMLETNESLATYVNGQG